MVIALLTGGLSLPQAILALLPEAPSMAAASDRLSAFHEAMSVFLGACDGPAAVVACDGDEAVAHLDRNGLRPLWLLTTKDYALAASELTGTVDLGPRRAAEALRAGGHRGGAASATATCCSRTRCTAWCPGSASRCPRNRVVVSAAAPGAARAPGSTCGGSSSPSG